MAFVEIFRRLDDPVDSVSDWWKIYEASEEKIRGTSMSMAMVSIMGQKPHK